MRRHILRTVCRNSGEEIEVTPEMIDAGIRTLEDQLLEDTVMQADWFRRELVCDVFSAMISFRPGLQLLRQGSE
jgi:hypothetical protein